MFFRIDDEVEVIAGADKGHRGKVLKIDRKTNKLVVEGAGRVWKQSPAAGTAAAETVTVWVNPEPDS